MAVNLNIRTDSPKFCEKLLVAFRSESDKIFEHIHSSVARKESSINCKFLFCRNLGIGRRTLRRPGEDVRPPWGVKKSLSRGQIDIPQNEQNGEDPNERVYLANLSRRNFHNRVGN